MSKQLEVVFPNRTAQSYNSHLRRNYTMNKNYEMLVAKFVREKGERGLERVRSKLFQGNATSSQLQMRTDDTGRQTEQVVRTKASRPRPTPTQRQTPTSMEAVVQSSSVVTTSATSSNEIVIDREESRTNIGIQFAEAAALATVMDSLATQMSKISDEAPGPNPEHIRRITEEHSSRLIEKLSLWLKTRFEPALSSQSNSILGYVQGSQDTIQPPDDLFVEMSLEVSEQGG